MRHFFILIIFFASWLALGVKGKFFAERLSFIVERLSLSVYRLSSMFNVSFADFCRDSAIQASLIALAAPKVNFADFCRDSAIQASLIALAAPKVLQVWSDATVERNVQCSMFNVFRMSCTLWSTLPAVSRSETSRVCLARE